MYRYTIPQQCLISAPVLFALSSQDGVLTSLVWGQVAEEKLPDDGPQAWRDAAPCELPQLLQVDLQERATFLRRHSCSGYMVLRIHVVHWRTTCSPRHFSNLATRAEDTGRWLQKAPPSWLRATSGSWEEEDAAPWLCRRSSVGGGSSVEPVVVRAAADAAAWPLVRSGAAFSRRSRRTRPGKLRAKNLVQRDVQRWYDEALVRTPFSGSCGVYVGQKRDAMINDLCSCVVLPANG